MRHVVYAAAAYAVCMGCADAFAPVLISVPRAKRVDPVSMLRSQAEDPAAVLARVDAMMSNAPARDASAPAATVPVNSAPPPAPEDAASVVARVNAKGGGVPVPQPTPRWRWSCQDSGGYTPRRSGP